MNKLLSTLLLVLLALNVSAQQTSKPRVLISTDIGGTDPDDNQSLAHLLMYSEMFDLEGLVSSPSFGDGSTSEIFRMIDVYEKDLPKLKQHVQGLMEPEALRKLVKQGRKDALPPCGYGWKMWHKHCTMHPTSHRRFASIGLAALTRNGASTASATSLSISPICG